MKKEKRDNLLSVRDSSVIREDGTMIYLDALPYKHDSFVDDLLKDDSLKDNLSFVSFDVSANFSI